MSNINENEYSYQLQSGKCKCIHNFQHVISSDVLMRDDRAGLVSLILHSNGFPHTCLTDISNFTLTSMCLPPVLCYVGSQKDWCLDPILLSLYMLPLGHWLVSHTIAMSQLEVGILRLKWIKGWSSTIHKPCVLVDRVAVMMMTVMCGAPAAVNFVQALCSGGALCMALPIMEQCGHGYPMASYSDDTYNLYFWVFGSTLCSL